MSKMHENELEINEDLVHTLIQSQCPQWLGLPLKPIVSSGTDNALFRLGSEYVIRLPRIEWETGSIHKSINKEYEWVPKLARLLKFGAAIVATMLHFLKVDVAFFSAAMLMILTKCIRLDTAYRSIQWPILFLVAALIPVGNATITSGFATFIAKYLYFHGQHYPVWLSLYAIIVICILSATLFNTAIVALLFSPGAIQFAAQWVASPDPFLMAVAIGASCSFITPIGHQSNMLILGPGNYRFGDFWRMGLPLAFIVSIVATFSITLWPAYT